MEVVKQSTAVMVVVRCWERYEIKCIELRSAIIQTVLTIRDELLSALSVKECFVDLKELSSNSYPLIYSHTQFIKYPRQ